MGRVGNRAWRSIRFSGSVHHAGGVASLFRSLCMDAVNMDAITTFGLFAVIAMLVFYALEDRSPWYVLAFAGACALASIYGFLQGAWPFGIIEANLHTYCRSPLASENALVDDPHSPGGAGSVMARRPARSLRLSSWTRRQTGRCLPRRRCRNSRSNTRPHRCGTPSPRRPSSRLCSG